MHAYLLTNRATGQRYVGITSQVPKNRWRAHVTQAKRGIYQTLLHQAIREHGDETFDFIVLQEFHDYDEMLQAERVLIREHNSLVPNGYNMTIGGQGTMGYKWKESDRQNLRVNRKGRDMSVAIAASVAVNKGKPLSVEHRAKISASHMGKKMGPMSAAHKAKISTSGRGRQRSAEAIENMRKAQTERWQDPTQHQRSSELASKRNRSSKGLFLPSS